MMSVRRLVSPLSGSSEYLSRNRLGADADHTLPRRSSYLGETLQAWPVALDRPLEGTSPCRRSLRAISN